MGILKALGDTFTDPTSLGMITAPVNFGLAMTGNKTMGRAAYKAVAGGGNSDMTLDPSSAPDPASLEEPVQVDYESLLKYQQDAIRQISAVNQEVLPGLVQSAQDIGRTFSQSMNPQIAKEFYGYLSNVNPNWRQDFIGQQQGALTQVSNFANQLMSGKLDQEIIDNTMSTMSELGYSRGQFGGLAASNVARNLGLTSLQLKQQGAQLLTEAVSPLSARLLSTTTSLMPQLVNSGAAASQMLGYLAGGLGSGQTGQSSIANAVTTNADLAWSSRLSAFNASMDMWTNQQNMDMYNKAIKIQQQNNTWSTIGTILGMGGAAGLLAL